MSDPLKNESVSYGRSENFELVHLKNCSRTYESHSHTSMFTVGIVSEGNVLLIRQAEETISAGQFYVIPPHQAHSLILHGNYDLLSICIEATDLSTLTLEQLTKLFDDALSLYSLDTKAGCAVELARALHKQNAPSIEKPEIAADARLIRAHPEQPHRITGLAKKALTNKANYIKTFKEETGVTPHRFQLQSRIRRVQRALEQNQDISTLAVEMGFYDQSHLNKCFKDFVGMTPVAYKDAVIDICRPPKTSNTRQA